MREAAEQSGRLQLPRVLPLANWEDALCVAGQSHAAVVPWEEERETGLRTALAAERARPGDNSARFEFDVAVCIGPEGGLEVSEIAAARAHGIMPVSLGPRILRAETAAIAAITIALSEWADLG